MIERPNNLDMAHRLSVIMVATRHGRHLCKKINQRGKKAKVEKAEKRTSLLSSPETETESSDSERRNPEEELTVHLHPNQKEMLLLH